MQTIILNRTQLEQLLKVFNHFDDIQEFKLTADSSSGIGPTVKVSFTIFNSNDASVDITDVSTW